MLIIHMIESKNNALVDEFVSADVGFRGAFIHLLQKVNGYSDGNDFLVLLFGIKILNFLRTPLAFIVFHML